MTDLIKLNAYLHTAQYQTLNYLLKGEEKKGIEEIINRNLNIINNTPDVYQQDGKGDKAIVYFHYFYDGCDWFITEIDRESLEFFGLVRLNHGGKAELGYISIIELTKSTFPIELDLHFQPKTIKEIKKEYNI